jgi:hypothetical protein
MDSNLSRSISRSLSRSSWKMEEVFASGRYSRRTSQVDEDEEALKWAAIEKLPTYDRLRTSIMQTFTEGDQPQPGHRQQHKEVDVTKLDMNERQQIIDKIFKVAEEDNENSETELTSEFHQFIFTHDLFVPWTPIIWVVGVIC